MSQFSKKIVLVFLSFLLIMTSCNTGKKEKQFTVKGTLKNSKANRVFLEEVIPATLMQTIVDSSVIEEDGSFSLKTKFGSEKIYTLRLSNKVFSFASLINDAPSIKLTADFDNMDNGYNVEGSVLSMTIKEISTTYPKKWANLYGVRKVYDSLQNAKGPENMIKKVYDQGDSTWTDLKNGIINYLNSSTSAAFTWYLLRHFQQIFTMEEYSEELGKAEKKFPGNEMLIAARDRLNRQIADAVEKQKKEKENETEKTNAEKPEP